MKPFSISEEAKQVVGTYPSSEIIRNALGSLKREERLGFLRLWVSEGIPFAFQGAPMLYESLRTWLSLQLSVHPKVITTIGSARTGYSLCASPKYGQIFGPDSDLDLSIIDQGLFSELCEDYLKWQGDYDSGQCKPKTKGEAKYWPHNRQTVPHNISRGFIDPHMIPAWDRYVIAQRVLNSHALLTSKFSITPSAPKFRKISSRVYRDWEAFVSQLERNLYFTLQSFVPAVAPN